MSDSRARTAKQQDSYRAALRRLSAAQKPPARSSPAYSRYVNRRIGRYLAAASYRIGLTPNAVTAVSAVITFASIALLVIFPPSWGLGVAVALGLLLGYAFDSADGQVSRLTGRSSPAGEWLDHMVDSTKASAMPIALAIGFYRFEVVPVVWLLVPLGFAVVSAVLFFSMILTEQLRRQRGIVSLASETPGRMPSWLRAVAVAPMDYGVLCLTFGLLGALPVFLVVYSVIFAATTLFLVLSSAKWFLELRALPTAPPGTTANSVVHGPVPNATTSNPAAPNRTVTP